MAGPLHDVAAIRLDNALALFDEFVHQNVKNPDAATLRGLEKRFAQRLQIQPSYWSQIKSRSRQIGERLARQFEQLCHKPYGWMDQPHATPPGTARLPDAGPAIVAQDDDERFLLGLVLNCYRRHPQRTRARVLDLLGEVMGPAGQHASPASRASDASPAAPLQTARSRAEPVDDHTLWLRSQAGVAPLRRKR